MSGDEQDGPKRPPPATVQAYISPAAKAEMRQLQEEFRARTGGSLSERQIVDEALAARRELAEWKAAGT